MPTQVPAIQLSIQPSNARVIIVGAGPSGSSAAFHLLENGVEDIVVLDKAGFPRDKLCGGGLTRKAQKELDRMGIYDEVSAAAYAVPKPYIVLPSGTALYARPRQEKLKQLLVLNRRILDEMVMKRARQRGAEIREGVEVKEFVRENGRDDGRVVGVRTGDGEVLTADVVVVAAGARSGRLRPEGASPVRGGGTGGPLPRPARRAGHCQSDLRQEVCPRVRLGLPRVRGHRQCRRRRRRHQRSAAAGAARLDGLQVPAAAHGRDRSRRAARRASRSTPATRSAICSTATSSTSAKRDASPIRSASKASPRPSSADGTPPLRSRPTCGPATRPSARVSEARPQEARLTTPTCAGSRRS